MIIGIGVDVVHAYRLKRWQTIPGLLERYFHPAELRTALSRGSGAALSLAARFAAKEAFGKALGMGLSGIVLKDIMVVNQHNGKPEIQLFGTALRALEQSGAHRVHLSLTHERDNAIAMVVLEAFPENPAGDDRRTHDGAHRA
ncbi:MAG: holo-ACP synthase [Treponema sp.]|jgi:holo-[acyl-carrier protein] synthase|nr:holo-ACP synthase [Treponema sp.]